MITTTTELNLREPEIQRVTNTLLSGEGILVLGETGIGKTYVLNHAAALLKGQGWTVAVATYGGSAKDVLLSIAEQLGVEIVEVIPGEEGRKDKIRNLTALELKTNLIARLSRPKTVLACDDAQRFPASLRYWLEDVVRSRGLLMLFATQPPAKDIFLKNPVINMTPLSGDQIRVLLNVLAADRGIVLRPAQVAAFQEQVGGNPGLAVRVIREEGLDFNSEEGADHSQYVDGTPFLVAGLSAIGILRFVGIGMGDRALYIIGGIAMILAISLRAVLYAANRGGNKTKLGRGR